MKKCARRFAAVAALAVALWAGDARAQSICPTIANGAVLTAGQWNACFSAKQDSLGYIPLSIAGGVMQGRLVTAPSTTANANFNIPPGTAPTSPINGDMWSTNVGLYVRINGVTIGPLGGSFTATSPMVVTFPGGGVVNYAFDFTVANTFLAQQTNQGATTTSPGWYTQVAGDTVPRVRIGLNATDIPSIAFGPGNAVRDIFIERVSAAKLRFGAPDAAAPVVQTISVQNTVAGTSNTAGANTFIQGSQGTGNAGGGTIQFQVAPAGSSGTAQNPLVAAFSINSGLVGSFNGSVTVGAATGGSQGTGTVNVATGYYVNGVPIAPITGGATGQILQGVTSSAPVWTATPTLGASGTLGTLAFGNATTGTVTLQPAAGALGSSVLSMPAFTDTLAVLAGSQAFTNKTYNGLTVTTTTGTFTLTNAKIFSVSNSLTLAGTDATTMTFPTTTATIARTDAGQTFTGVNTFSSGTTFSSAITYGGVTLANAVTGTGSMALSASPTFTGTITAASVNLSGPLAITSASANAFDVGLNGTTNPAFQVDASTATSVTGIKIKSAASGGGVAVSAISSSAAENLAIDALGTGTITLGGVSTGAIIHTRATTLSAALTYGGVTLANSVTGTGSMVLAAAPTITGHPTIEGVTSTGATGTGNFVFSAAPTITGHPTIEGVTSTGATGTGNFVFATSPSVSSLTVTTAFTATGLVTNADLANASTTVNGQTCTLGLTCTITATAASITVGTTTVASGNTGRVEFNNAGVLGEYTITGTAGSVVMSAAPTVVGGSFTALTALAIRDTSAAFDVTLAASSSTTLTAGRTLTFDVGNVAHTLKFGTTANTITFPNLASFTVITNGDTGTVTNAMLANSTISGISLGGTLGTLTFGTHLTAGGASYNGSTGVTITSDATSANTASTIVARDGSGNFTAGTITASLTGHASLDCALAGCTMAGTLAMGSNSITSTGTVTSNTDTITSSSANSLAVGLNGSTNPAFNVDSSTGSQVAGLNVKGAVTGGTVAISVIDSGSNANISINAKGSGTIAIGSVSTGAVTITPALTGSSTINAVTGFQLNGAATTGNYLRGNGTNFVSSAILAADLPLATNAAIGGMRGDGTTITCAAGVCTAVGASATSIDAGGATSVSNGVSGQLLYDNAGNVGHETITTALGSRTTLPTTSVVTDGAHNGGFSANTSGTYTTPANVLWVEIYIMGGGGAGAGSGTSAGNGTNGNPTCWNTTGAACTTPVIQAGGGGGGGAANGSGGAGGLITGTGTCNDFQNGVTTPGTSGVQVSAYGANGGGSRWGGAGGGGYASTGATTPGAGGVAAPNSGGGGGGAGDNATGGPGAGGASGAFCYYVINSPAGTYTYAIGGTASGGTAGTAGNTGGGGSAGKILAIEHYGS